jgi:hypothetical protein
MIRSTSKSFAQALERPAYFGNVTIIFPDSWAADPLCSPLMTSANVSDLPWARSHRADIRITPDHPVFGWQPHSFQYGRCQQSGLPINVPASFVTSDTVLAKGKKKTSDKFSYLPGLPRVEMANNLRSLRNHRNENGTRMGSLSLRRFRRGRNAKRPTSPVRLFDVPNGKSGQDNAPQYLLRSQNAFRKLEQVHSCNIRYNEWRLKNGNQIFVAVKIVNRLQLPIPLANSSLMSTIRTSGLR